MPRFFAFSTFVFWFITFGHVHYPWPSVYSKPLKSDTGFEKDKDYYFMVLPGTLSDGFSLTFTDKDNLTWQKTYSNEATMNRSNITNEAHGESPAAIP